MTDSDSINPAGKAASSHAPARAPRQLRGHARVDAILDAAAALIAEEGLGGITMHILARRARTSIGSMYHFFADLDGVLAALAERHRAEIRAINVTLTAIPDAVWQQRTTDAAIMLLVTPYVEYMRRHADFLPLMHGRMAKEDDADFIRTIQRVLHARLPGLTPVESGDYAAMLHAIAAGAMHIGYQTDPQRAEMYQREIPHAMAAYLGRIETTGQ
jgi:AcrR family transcriptional regulator